MDDKKKRNQEESKSQMKDEQNERGINSKGKGDLKETRKMVRIQLIKQMMSNWIKRMRIKWIVLIGQSSHNFRRRTQDKRAYRRIQPV